MSRVINTDSTGKNRNQLMRTCAELLRHLSQKPAIDDDAKDMAAYLVVCLQRIEDGIDESASVWEKRDYWIKAEQLRQRWAWVGNAAARLENLIRKDSWDRLPELLTGLFSHFAEVKITRLTRSADLWQGAYQELLRHDRQRD